MLTQQEVINNWEKRAMFIDWKDGSDSLLQDNGYTLEDALNFKNQGYNIYLD